MELNDKKVLVCSCEGTMALDAKGLAKACGGDAEPISQLCRAQLEVFEAAAKDAGQLLVACTQEAPLFVEAAGELGDGGAELSFCNIRERAGWCREDAGKASKNLTAKMAALLAEATLDIPGTTSVGLASEGALLILGGAETALAAAERVAGRLDVTVVTSGGDAPPPRIMDVPIFQGRAASAAGHLGAFEVAFKDFAPASPSARRGLAFEAVGQSGSLECDLILDLRGDAPLLRAPEKRDGYFNPDPGNPALVADAILELIDLVGEFEKPRYIDYDAGLCAHARSEITGCTKCLDSCPAGAITPDGDKVAYDPYICAGCGTCASVCPTGAAKYVLPAGDSLFQRLRTVLATYRDAGGANPMVLVHDADWGDQMIATMARSGGGLPANALPFAVNSSVQIGLEFLLAAAAYGAERVVVLVPPSLAGETDGLRGEIQLAETVADGLGYGGGRFELLDEADPEAVEARLHGLQPAPGMPAAEFLALGRKRSIMNQALAALHEAAPAPVDHLELPAGAPFGAVEVDVAGCTLCLACVGACPTGALKDNPDKPQLSFNEQSCVQCGLCRNTCPESVISLSPRISFEEAARNHQVVKEEEPFECIRCGKEFGTKSTIERMVEKLDGHAMFADGKALDRLKMCEDCRVVALTEEDVQPLAHGSVPVTRTTEDYLREREELRQQAAQDMKAKGLDGADDT
ncbi:MAG: 4Fe-4S binding protein [Magnetovibrio sp.]|nr:4Fe-4S binding protein [Magnetovibrio sp.]